MAIERLKLLNNIKVIDHFNVIQQFQFLKPIFLFKACFTEFVILMFESFHVND